MPTPSFTDIIRAYLEAQFGGDVPPIPGITIDSELSTTSENPVQNKVITAALALKAALTDIPQMATQANMTDWTAGKTVDAATLRTNILQAISQINDIYVSLSNKANVSDIPAAVSDLVNDSGFQTAAQVQTAISTATNPLQSKAITDTGRYYSTDTVDGALQEIGAEIAGVNTLLGSGVIT